MSLVCLVLSYSTNHTYTLICSGHTKDNDNDTTHAHIMTSLSSSLSSSPSALSPFHVGWPTPCTVIVVIITDRRAYLCGRSPTSTFSSNVNNNLCHFSYIAINDLVRFGFVL